MKNFILILCLFCISFNGLNQNLVPNYSFENYTVCPTASSQINYALPWTGTNNSTDYYNACSSFISSSVPQNMGSYYLYPKTGNAFSAIWAYNIPGNNYREYLKVLLNDTMLNGKCYYIEFYTLIANICRFSINNLSAHLSNDTISSTGTGLVLNLTPHISSFHAEYIKDTIEWKKISGIYVALGGERAITIGNFKDDSNTDTITNNNGSYPGAYYYIDDVSVIPVDSILGGFQAYAGNDTSVLSGDSVFIGQQITGLNCNWYDSGGVLIASNISGIYVHPTSNTFYTVEQNLCGIITYDTVNVTVTHVGIHENDWGKKINIYPNPNEGKFSIGPFGLNITELNIKVIDVNGKMIYEKIIDSGDRMFNLNLDSPNGIYMLYISNPKTNDHIVKRIVVQK